MPYDEDRPIPPGYHVETDAQLGLIIGGAAMWLVPYSIGVAIAAEHELADQGGWFLLPVAGPAVYLGARDGCSDDADAVTGVVCGFADTMLTVVVVADVLAQAGGLVMMLAGLATMEDKLVLDEPPATSWVVVPARVGDSGTGAMAVGTF